MQRTCLASFNIKCFISPTKKCKEQRRCLLLRSTTFFLYTRCYFSSSLILQPPRHFFFSLDISFKLMLQLLRSATVVSTFQLACVFLFLLGRGAFYDPVKLLMSHTNNPRTNIEEAICPCNLLSFYCICDFHWQVHNNNLNNS